MESELVFTFITFDEGKKMNCEGRMVCVNNGEVIEIFEGTMRQCINRQLKMMYVHGITDETFRIRKGDAK